MRTTAAGWLRRLGALLLAGVLAGVVAIIVQTQFVLVALAQVGVATPLAQRLAMTGQDILGMGPMYLPLFLLALLVGCLVAGLLCRWLGRLRPWVYLVAGFCAIVALHLLMQAVFGGIVAIAGARSVAGLAGQGAAGALGGWLFARLTRVRRA